MQFIKFRGTFVLTLKCVHGLVVITAQNKRTLLFWTLSVTRVVRARSYETIHSIGMHCIRTYGYIHEVMNPLHERSFINHLVLPLIYGPT